MDLIQSNKKLQEIEINQDLLRWKIGKWSAWPILRFTVAAQLAQLTIDTTDIRLTISEHLQQSFHDLVGLAKGKHSQVFLYVASSNRVEKENSLYKDVIFDDVIQYLSGYFKVETINNKYYRDQSQAALYPSNMTTSSIQLFSNFLSRYFLTPSVGVIAKRIYSQLQESLPELNLPRLYILRILAKYYWSKRIYGSLISYLKPQIIFLQTAYTNHALVAAAKETNIPVIEFQHGIIDRYHPGYSWTDYATAYKTQMIIPDRIFIYGDYWRNELLENGFWDDELRSVGSLRIDQYRNQVENEVGKKYQINNRIKKIVVTTQSIAIESLISFLSEFIRITPTPVELFIKLHPREFNRKPYEAAFSTYNNVHIISGYESPSTFELLSTADYHASIHSTCHYEALGLGIPTIVLPLTNYMRMLPLCDQAPGCALIVNSPAEVGRIITQNHPVPQEIRSFFFREKAIDNMLNELQLMGLQTKSKGDSL